MYVDAGTKAAGGLLRKHTISPTSGSMHPVLGLTNKAASEFVDEKIKSKVDVAALARHGVNMNHPCVRMHTKDEVLANRKFLAASAMCFSTHRFLDVRLFDSCYGHLLSDLLVQDVPFEEMTTTTKCYQTSRRYLLKSEVGPDKLLREMVVGHMRGQIVTETRRRDQRGS